MAVERCMAMILVGIPEFPGYKASDDGHIYSYKVHKNIDYNITPRRLKEHQGRTSLYYWVCLRKKNRSYLRLVHRLVLFAFVGPCPVGMTGSHLNGNMFDNRPINLKWETKKENDARKIIHGTDDCGIQNSRARFNANEIRTIRQLLAQGEKAVRIAERFNVNDRLIGKIKRGEHYAR